MVSLFVCEVVANSTVFLHLMRWVSPISVLIVLSSGFDLFLKKYHFLFVILVSIILWRIRIPFWNQTPLKKNAYGFFFRVFGFHVLF